MFVYATTVLVPEVPPRTIIFRTNSTPNFRYSSNRITETFPLRGYNVSSVIVCFRRNITQLYKHSTKRAGKEVIFVYVTTVLVSEVPPRTIVTHKQYWYLSILIEPEHRYFSAQERYCKLGHRMFSPEQYTHSYGHSTHNVPVGAGSDWTFVYVKTVLVPAVYSQTIFTHEQYSYRNRLSLGYTACCLRRHSTRTDPAM
jgi:hypothetical protein